ncbi:MAG TPA: GerMN domain-containing protein [Pyrinomonadaceae bacterium]|nr:GerMN domain-containing protein [Pyrinomonadaceae bacterium]HMP66954.1 GerMN domain-containing protein [Pyrinomonadaceae bacterium]
MRILYVLIFIWVFQVGVCSQTPETMTIQVFFLNSANDPYFEDCHDVKPTPRTIAKTRSVARAALEELFKGATPEEEARGFVSLAPRETAGILKSINIKNGSAYINFNEIVYKQLGTATTSCGGGFFTSIEATLKQFPTVKKVFYAIEGSPADFYEWVQVGECPKELKNCDNRNFIK